VLCARILAEAATDAQKKNWLPRIASGERIFALALTEARYGWSPDAIGLAARRDGSGFRVTGTKLFVHDAIFATDLLVMVRAPGGSGTRLLRIDTKAPGVAIRALDGFLTGMSEVRFDNVEVSEEDIVGNDGDAWTRSQAAMLAAIAVLCAYKVGGCRAVFDMSVGYSRERTQFQQPIGRFQRVQDHVIRIVNFLDAARWTTYEALWKLDTDSDAAGSVHVAKAVASEGYMGACDFAHEVHAGIGVVREYGLTLHTKMSRSLYHCLGAPSIHRKRLETVLGLAPA
jgi:alkylation response protein AidB-like acyl-CoA dehydrogenase